MRCVYSIRVFSRNFIDDFGADLKNIVGGRLGTYERMLKLAFKEVTDELYEKNGSDVRNVKFEVTEFGNKSMAVIAYGEVE